MPTLPANTFIGLLIVAILSASMEADENATSEQSSQGDPVAQLLEIAWTDDENAFKLIRIRYEAGAPESIAVSRWHFAYGISLLNLKRQADAAEAFQAAITEGSEFDFAPWKALIWTTLTLKRHGEAIEQMQTLAALVRGKQFTGTDDDQQRIAVWTGQTISAMEKLNSSPKVRQMIAAGDARLIEIWGQSFAEDYASGKEYTASIYADLMNEVRDATETATRKELQAKAEKQGKLAAAAESADEKRDEIQQKSEKIQRQVEQQLLQIDKQLARLERDYNYLDLRAKALLQSISLAQTAIRDLQRTRNNNSGTQLVRGETQDQQLQRISMMARVYEEELSMTTLRAAQVTQQAMLGLHQRERLVEAAQTAAGELGVADESLARWKTRIGKESERLEKSKIKGTSITTKAKRLKAKQLSTYLDFDLDWERIQLSERGAAETAN